MKVKTKRPHLFLELLCQLRTPGFLYLIGLLLLALLGHSTYALIGTSSTDPAEAFISFEQMLPSVFTVSLLFAVILVLRAFSPLHSRSASDFYDALPVSRGRLCLLRLGAASLWYLSVLAITFGFSVLLYILSFAYDRIDFSSALFGLLHCAVIGCFLMALTAFGMAVTGKLLPMLAVLCLGIYFPYVFMTRLAVLFESLVTRSHASTSSVLVPLWKMLQQIHRLSDRLLPITYSDSAEGIPTLVYPLFLTVILVVLSYICCSRRRSESAGQPTVRPWVNSVNRILLGVMILWLGILPVSGRVLHGMWFFFLSIMVTVGYEVLTVGNWKRVPKALVLYLPTLLLAWLIPYWVASILEKLVIAG